VLLSGTPGKQVTDSADQFRDGLEPDDRRRAIKMVRVSVEKTTAGEQPFGFEPEITIKLAKRDGENF